MLSDYFYENVAEPIVVDLKHLRKLPVPPVNFEAAAILISVEKKHIKMTNYSLWNDLEFDWCYMEGRPDDGDYEEYPSLFENLYPCETLLAARSVASKETLDYVAVHLALENGK